MADFPAQSASLLPFHHNFLRHSESQSQTGFSPQHHDIATASLRHRQFTTHIQPQGGKAHIQPLTSSQPKNPYPFTLLGLGQWKNRIVACFNGLH